MSLNDSAQLSLSTSTMKGYETLLAETNELLARVGINAKKIQSVNELSRVSSSMFVAVYESLFRTKLVGIIRNPQTRDEYTLNVQCVIDELSEQIQIDLKHISGEDIADGDIRSISNLLHIFVRIFKVAGQTKNDQDEKSDSISTHESDFQDMTEPASYAIAQNDVNLIDSYSLPPSNSYPNIIGEEIGYSEYEDIQHKGSTHTNQNLVLHHIKHNNFTHANNQHPNFYPTYEPFKAEDSEQITISSIDKTEEIQKLIHKKNKKLALEYKQEVAQRRRDILNHNKNKAKMAVNLKKEHTIRDIQHKRWLDDFAREQNSLRLKSKSNEHLLLRKVYQGLVRKMRQWEIEEHNQSKEKTNLLQEDLNWKVQSLETMLSERVEIYKAKEMERLKEEREAHRTHKQMTSELKRTLLDKHKKFLQDQNYINIHKRDQTYLKRRESFNDMISILNADKWETTLRGSYPAASKPYKSNNTNGYGNKAAPFSGRHGFKFPAVTPYMRVKL